MENQTEKVKPLHQVFVFVIVLISIAAVFFAMGMLYSSKAHAQSKKTKGRIVYPKKTNLDFRGTEIEGVINNPTEFYFKHRPEEKFKSLVQIRKNFHREMLRDVVTSK